MKSSVVKHSIQLQRHKTSVSLEDPFWNELKKIALAQRVTLPELVTTIDDTRGQGNLSSAIRLFVLNHFRNQKRWMGVPVGLKENPTGFFPLGPRAEKVMRPRTEAAGSSIGV